MLGLLFFLLFFCNLYNFYFLRELYKEVTFCFLLLAFFLINVFLTLDIFIFYICFESVLIPMILLLKYFGFNKRKTRASLLLFFYTFFGSLLMLVVLLVIFNTNGTFSILVIENMVFSSVEQKIF